MSNYVTRLAQELRNHYDAHDRVAFEATLDRMVRNMTYTGPVPPPRAIVAPIAGCTRKGGPCECTEKAEAEVCMFRGPAPLLVPDLPKPPPPLCEASVPANVAPGAMFGTPIIGAEDIPRDAEFTTSVRIIGIDPGKEGDER